MEGGGHSGVQVTDDTPLRQIPSRNHSVVLRETSTNRFVFVDGLRGLAALAIVIFHIWWYEPDPHPPFASMHWIVDAAILRIRAGVQVLLVISGFVIAYSLRNAWVTPREFVMFLSRRFVRLAPAYWVALGVIILVDAFCQRAWDLPSPFDGHVSIPRISAHMTFLQDILGHEALSAGVWTICIEMQFYVVAILTWCLAQYLANRPDANKPRPSVLGILTVYAPFAFASLFLWRPLESTSPWVIHFFWMFFLGMMAWWTLERTVPHWIFAAIVVVAIGEIAFDREWWYENSVALTTAVLIYTAGRLNRLDKWLNWGWLQHVSRISYSLYLIHFPVCHLLTSAGWKLFGDSPDSMQATAILLTSFFASLLAAEVLYFWVEEPSSRLAASLKKLPVGEATRELRLPQSV